MPETIGSLNPEPWRCLSPNRMRLRTGLMLPDAQHPENSLFPEYLTVRPFWP